MEQLAQEIIKIVELQLGKTGVLGTDRLIEDLGAQSADVANIASALEDRFGVHVSETQLAQLRAVRDVIILVAEQRASPGGREGSL